MPANDPLDDPIDGLFGAVQTNPSQLRDAMVDAIEESDLDVDPETIRDSWTRAGVTGDFRKSRAFDAMIDRFLDLHANGYGARVYTKPGTAEGEGYDVYWQAVEQTENRWRPMTKGISRVPAGLIPLSDEQFMQNAVIQHEDGGAVRWVKVNDIPDILEKVFNELIPTHHPFHALLTPEPEGEDIYRVEFQVLRPVKVSPYQYDFYPLGIGTDEG